MIETEGELVGFNILISGEIEEMMDGIGREHLDQLNEIKNRGPFILIKSTAIKKEYQGQGVWSELYQYAMNELNGNEKTALSICWKFNNTIPLKPILEKKGFYPLFEIKHYWKEESLLKGYGCPVCNDPPCLCDVVVFIRTL